MRVGLCCATDRGRRVLEALASVDDLELVVASFREESWEPPFLDEIRAGAERADAPFFETRRLATVADDFFADPVDVLLCVSWRYLIPRSVYERATRGGFTMHDSLLPAYRGFSPTVWAMINGEPRTGVTLLQMVEDVDAGDVFAQRDVEIGPDDDIADVIERVTGAYVEMATEQIPALLDGALVGQPQAHEGATFTTKLGPDDFVIDWSWPSQRIHDLVRATTRPYAGARTTFDGRPLLVWRTRLEVDPPNHVGAVIGRYAGATTDGAVRIITGDGSILVTEVEDEDGGVRPAAEVLTSVASTLGSERTIRAQHPGSITAHRPRPID